MLHRLIPPDGFGTDGSLRLGSDYGAPARGVTAFRPLLQTAGIMLADALVFARSIQTLRGQRAASTQIQQRNQTVASD
jgi:hypothetical protein